MAFDGLLGGLGSIPSGFLGGLGLGSFLGQIRQQMAITTGFQTNYNYYANAQQSSGTSTPTGYDNDTSSGTTTGNDHYSWGHNTSGQEDNNPTWVVSEVQLSEIYVNRVENHRAERGGAYGEAVRQQLERQLVRRTAAQEMAIAEQAQRLRQRASDTPYAEFRRLNEIGRQFGLNLEGRTLEQRRALINAARAQDFQRQLERGSMLDTHRAENNINPHFGIGQAPAQTEITSKDKEKAEVVAQEMLGEMIGEKELEVYNKTGRLYVRGEKADYIIPRSGHIQMIKKDVVIDLCVHLSERQKYPTTDNIITMKIMLENKEEEVLGKANKHGNHSRKDVNILPAACMEEENARDYDSERQAVRAA